MYMHAYLNPVPPEKSMDVITNYRSAVYHNKMYRNALSIYIRLLAKFIK